MIDYKLPLTGVIIAKCNSTKSYIVRWHGQKKTNKLSFKDFKLRQFNGAKRYGVVII